MIPSARRIVKGVMRRVTGRVEPVEALLEMLWPESLLERPPQVSVAPGYRLRQFETGDRETYLRLLAAAGMDACRLEYWEQHLLPGGFFLMEHAQSRALVATCMASHHPALRHPRAGNLGWLGADPAHGGKGLGRAAAAAVTARLIAGGYKRIYLETHDFRLPAIRIYLSMGWRPFLYQEDMLRRWHAVHEKLGIPFAAHECPGQFAAAAGSAR